jgi:ParB family chromosome partitioning protein
MKTHTIKIKLDYAMDILFGNKTFEIRKNDRDYQVGDYVHFVPIDNNGIRYVGCSIENKTYQITYILRDFGLQYGYIAFSIREVEE